MIPVSWRPHHREDDGELVGYLVPAPDLGERCVPVSLFGYPLGSEMATAAAADLLDAEGLACLAERWELQVDDADDPIAVSVVECTAERLVVANADFGYHRDLGTRFELPVPVDDRLARTGPPLSGSSMALPPRPR